MKINDEKDDNCIVIINATYDVGTENESEINTGSTSSFEIADNECRPMINRPELVLFLEHDENETRKNNVKL